MKTDITVPDPLFRPVTASSVASRDISIIDVLNMLLRHPRTLIVMPALGFLAGVALALTTERGWTADSRLRPQVDEARSSSRLAGLAAQFGIAVQSPTAESPQFYAEVLKSRALLREVVTTEYTVRSGDNVLTGDLIKLLEVEGDSLEERLNDAVSILSDLNTVSVDPRSGILSLRVQAPWPDLALAINQRMLQLVNEFNLGKRQSQARAEREFLQARLADARAEVQAAESELTAWLAENRRFDQAPTLQAQHDRLQRRVSLRQQVYTGIAQAFEQARMDEVRNTPVVTVVDGPEGSLKPKGRGLVTKSVAGLVLGGLLGAIVVFAMEYWRRQRSEHAEEFSELRRLWATAFARLRKRSS